MKQHDTTRGRTFLFVGISGLVHLCFSFLLLIVFTFGPGLDDLKEVHTVELVGERPSDLVEEPINPPSIVTPEQVRLGSPSEALDGHMGVRSLQISPNQGTRSGEGRASTHDGQLAGNDTQELREDPFTHPRLALSSRRPNETRVTTRDSPDDLQDSEPTPFMETHGNTTTRQAPRVDPRNNPDADSLRSIRSLQAMPIDAGEAAEQRRGESRGRRDEEMSRIPKDGALARAPDDHPLVPTTSGLVRPQPRNARSRRTRRDQASNRTLPDVMDMARPRGVGESLGRGDGSTRGRRGDVRGGLVGKLLWLSTDDQKYVDYFRGIYRKVHPLWLFPRRLQILMEQGDVLVQFTILSDGQVTGVRLRKSSGYPEFDRNVLLAIRKAAPFGPIPSGLGKQLQVLAPFEFSNPMVQ